MGIIAGIISWKHSRILIFVKLQRSLLAVETAVFTGVNSHNSEEQKALSDSRAGSSDVLSELDVLQSRMQEIHFLLYSLKLGLLTQVSP